ncbi:MAG: RNB domain-containing ribonuclease [Intrasporangium sp.]|uniref:RNB domain-containing ribonuclease n=1 Tax=Intrasporangium sp. TaxID=1925024 RepID=UPI003F7D1321
MAKRSIVYRRLPEPGAIGRQLAQRFAEIRREFEVPEDFPPQVIVEAQQAATSATPPDRDATDVPFVTIDPAGSKDLDQAMHLERQGDGYRVRYAIADVPAFVRPGGAIDVEARHRGQTIYCPDMRVQLHPSELSEGATSLLPDEVRPAFVWDITLGPGGEQTAVSVARALVRSVRRYDYDEVQRAVDMGTADEPLMLLKEIGDKRVALEQKRGGASLPLPEQVVQEDGKGGFSVSFRPLLPAEDWNAQISLLTGIAAAQLMLDGGIGILRTMPAPEPKELDRFRCQAAAAGVPWPEEQTYGAFLRTLDRTDPRHLALIHEATALFRGAGYTPFDGTLPEQREHAAVASVYAHVTAPLRRLVDRFGLVVCEALSQGTEVPGWARQALPLLPVLMGESDRRAGGVERGCTDAVEAAELQPLVGKTVEAIVVDAANGKSVTVQFSELAVLAKASGHAEPGASVRVRVDGADIATGKIELTVVA